MRGRERQNLPGRRKGAVALLTGIVVAAGLVLAGPAFATASVTVATGGSSISIDTTSASGGTGTWTTLSGPSMSESSNGDVGVGTLALQAPSGFEFNSGVTVTVANAKTSTSVKFASTSSGCGASVSSISATVTSSQISVYACNVSAGSNQKAQISWTGIKVRPTGTTPSSGNITQATGGATIAGVTAGSTSFGALSSVAGALHHLVPAPNPATITAGGSQGYTVTGQDQFNNPQTVPAGTTYAITPDGSCTGAACTATIAGSHTVTATNGGKTGTATLTVNAAALDHLVLSPGSATITAGGSQSYTAAGFDQYNNALGDQTAGTTFTISPNGSCGAGSCSATTAGSHTVTGTNGAATGTASLGVQAAAAANVSVGLAPTSVTANGSATSTATVTVTDSFGNARIGDTVGLSTSGDVAIGAVTDNGDGTYSATITASTTPGAETITATDGSATGSASLTELGNVTISSVSPSALGQGADGGPWHQTVVINGTNFVNGAVPDFGPGITVSFTTFVDSTQLKPHIIVGGSATTGPRNVTVTNPDTGAAVCASCFTVNPGPVVTTVTPNVRGAAWAGTVTVTGSNFQPGIKLNFGSSVGVTSLTRIDSNTLTVGLSIASAAAPGARNVVATNLDAGSSSCSGCFTVTARPTVDVATPGSAARGSSALPVTITGANFATGATVAINNGGVTISNVVVVDANTITLKVTISTGAVTGLRTFTVTNPDGGKGSKACFTVT